MSAWTPFYAASPPRPLALPVLVRHPDFPGLPRVAKWAPGLDGMWLSFVPFEGGEPGMRGEYVELKHLVSEGWEWAKIPE